VKPSISAGIAVEVGELISGRSSGAVSVRRFLAMLVLADPPIPAGVALKNARHQSAREIRYGARAHELTSASAAQSRIPGGPVRFTA
jgi:hypothetical protein